jgi:para-nitrobenzyl esterase
MLAVLTSNINAFLSQGMLRLCVLFVAFAAACSAVTVSTDAGPIVGYKNEFGSFSFKGVPYAAPPVGQLRFAAPVDPVAWTTPRNATVFSAGCYSECRIQHRLKDLACAPTVSEDCLYLNVYTPSLNASSNAPVIVFFHGGMFEWGAGGIPLYEGDKWAKEQNIILVTVNYRLNVFGALYTGLGGLQGNFMIQDQIQSLKWVNKNIVNFGGDPTRVTIMGQSAGATSVGVLLVTPSAWPYFSRAAMISDPYGLIPFSSVMAAELGNLVLAKLGCSRIFEPQWEVECLRNKTAEEIYGAMGTDILPAPDEVLGDFMQWVPVVDGILIPQQPLDAMSSGQFNKVPIYIGTVANETIPFIYALNFPPPGWLLDLALEYVFGETKGNQIAELYGPVPADQQNDVRAFFSMILTDYLFYCPSRNSAMHASKYNGGKTYVYFFDEHPSWALWYSGNNSNDPCVKYICHAFDLPTIFGTYWKLPPSFPSPSPGEWDIMHFNQKTIAELAHNGEISNWPGFSQPTLTMKNLSIPVAETAWLHGYRHKYCDYFDSIGYDRW